MSIYDNMLDQLSALDAWSPQNEAVSSLLEVAYGIYPRVQAILEPFTYINSNPGKEIRSQLIEAFNAWLNVPPERLGIIAGLVKMLHAASLL